jgi:hypothetical protein
MNRESLKFDLRDLTGFTADDLTDFELDELLDFALQKTATEISKEVVAEKCEHITSTKYRVAKKPVVNIEGKDTSTLDIQCYSFDGNDLKEKHEIVSIDAIEGIFDLAEETEDTLYVDYNYALKSWDDYRVRQLVLYECATFCCVNLAEKNLKSYTLATTPGVIPELSNRKYFEVQRISLLGELRDPLLIRKSEDS